MRTAQDDHGRGRRLSAPAAVVALAVAGIGLLGFGLSQQESRTPPAPALASGTHDHGGGEQWEQPPAGALNPTPSTTATTKPKAASGAAYAEPKGTILDRSVPTKVRIPSLDVSASMITLGLQKDTTMEVPQDGTSAGWYDGSPTPGELGPSVIAAHVTWQKKPAVFFELGALKKGQQIEVDRKDGTTAVFKVTDVGQYPKKDFPTDKVYGTVDRAALRLITCGGVFNGETGHHVDNVVVYADLVGTK